MPRPVDAPPEDVAQIESIMRSFMGALNKRDFSLSSPGWRDLSPNFTAQTGIVSTISNSKPLSLEEFREILKEYCSNYPENEYHIIDMVPDFGTTGVHLFANMINSGSTGGMKRMIAVIWYFEKVDERWQVMHAKDVRGSPVF